MSMLDLETLKQNNCKLWFKGTNISANAPKTITANGDAKQILPFPGAGIGMITGTATQYLSTPDSDDFVVGSGGITIEGWIYRPAVNWVQQICGRINANSPYQGYIVHVDENNKLRIDSDSNNFTGTINLSSINTWYYFTFYFNTSGVQRIWVNGILDVSRSNGPTTVEYADTMYIGCYPAWFDNHLKYLSELRISNCDRYGSSNFTPPRSQLQNDSNTKLLLHFLGSGNTFVDSSPTPKTITAYGDAKQLSSPCGSGVAYFDGSGDYLSTPDHADFTFGTGNFTLAGAFYFLALPTNPCFISQNTGSGTTNKWGWDYYSGNIRFWNDIVGGAYTEYAFAFIPSLNTWYYFQLIRNGTSLYFYVNGVQTGATANIGTLSVANPTVNVIIGQNTEGTAYFNGYMSELQISTYARTPISPTTPFKPDPYTKLLLHFDGVGQAFYDSSDPPGDNGFPILPDGVTVTPNGTFAIQKMKDGRNVYKLDGSTNYITISDHALWSMFLNNFTICGWINFTTIAANRIILGQYASSTSYWILQWTTSNTITLIGMISGTATFSYSCSFIPTAGSWYYITIQRSGSSCIMYINCVSQTVTTTAAFTTVATNVASTLNIGGLNSVYNYGNIKELQIFAKALTVDQIGALMEETYIQ